MRVRNLSFVRGPYGTRVISNSSVSSSPAATGPDLDRRGFLRASAAVGVGIGAVAVGSGVLAGTAAATPGGHDVFRHGVASGDPLQDRVVIWTRVTPTPESLPASGTGPATRVLWQVSRDPGFATVAASGIVTASVDRDHTVKVDASGLAPATGYHYRFTVLDGPAAGAVSPVGRTRTMAAAGTAVDRLRLAVVSCNNWEAGHFAGFRHIGDRGDVDIVVHLGDYIYEYEQHEYGGKNGSVRLHEPAHEIVTLADYRIRIAQYRTDPDLRELHRKVPFICTWDDHEVADNSWSGGAENHNPGEGDYGARRDASSRAYFEWMPVRPDSLAGGGTLYRRFRFGDLAELSMLDLRSYRDEPRSMIGEGREIDSAGRTITGEPQMNWLTKGITSSPTRWQLVGTSVLVTPVKVPPLPAEQSKALTDLLGIPNDGAVYNPDQWDGYAADRRRLFDAIVGAGKSNVVFLAGDIHSSWASDLPLDAADPDGMTVGVELVPPSITSNNIDDMLKLPEGNGVSAGISEAVRGMNRHIRYCELDRHGYGIVEISQDAVQMDLHFLHDRTHADSGVWLAETFRVDAGGGRLRLGVPALPGGHVPA